MIPTDGNEYWQRYAELTESGITTCPAGGELAVEGLVAVEFGQFELFHVETGEVGVELEWADVVKAGQRVRLQRRDERNVEQEIGFTRRLDDHAHLHIHRHSAALCRIALSV